MSLPNLNFNTWKRLYKHDNCDDAIELENEEAAAVADDTRALVRDVAEYYESYVRLMNLDKFFRNESVVVLIRKLKSSDDQGRWIIYG